MEEIHSNGCNTYRYEKRRVTKTLTFDNGSGGGGGGDDDDCHHSNNKHELHSLDSSIINSNFVWKFKNEMKKFDRDLRLSLFIILFDFFFDNHIAHSSVPQEEILCCI